MAAVRGAMNCNHRMRGAGVHSPRTGSASRLDEADTGDVTGSVAGLRAVRERFFPWKDERLRLCRYRMDCCPVSARAQRCLHRRPRGALACAARIDQTAGSMVPHAVRVEPDASLAMKAGGMQRKREGNPWQGGQRGHRRTLQTVADVYGVKGYPAQRSEQRLIHRLDPRTGAVRDPWVVRCSERMALVRSGARCHRGIYL